MSTLTKASAAFSGFDLQAPVLYRTEPGSSAHLTKYEFKPIAGAALVEPGKRYITGLAGLAVLLHGAAVIAYLNYPETAPATQPKVNKVEIEFIKPAPPEVIEPPKPPPPQTAVKQTPQPAAKPAPALKTPVAQEITAPDAITVAENRVATASTSPVVAAPPAPEPQPVIKTEEPVTEATGDAAYLNNPPPEYPAFAQRQGWEGKVLLRVHVLASGKPDKVEIKQSSGRKTLDESAMTAVRNWTFIPSKRGNTAIDGWATVPIEFKQAK